MKAIYTLIIGLILSGTVNAQALLIYGGDDHDVFLGCLNCNRYDSGSIWNEFGTYGSKFSSSSIWNEFGTYGGEFSLYSPFNEFSTFGPILVDSNGNSYGYFTANEYMAQRTTSKLALLIVEHWEKISEDVGKGYDLIFE